MASVGRAERACRLGEALLATIGSVVACSLALFLADRLLKLPESARSTLLALAGILVGCAILASIRRLRLPSDSTLALQIESRSGRPLQAYLVTAVELDDPAAATRYGFSASLVQACARDAVRIAGDVDPWSVATNRPVRQLGLVALVLLGAGAAAVWLDGPAMSFVLFSRYLGLTPPFVKPPVLTLSPGNSTRLVGSRVEIGLSIQGEVGTNPSPVLRRWAADLGRGGRAEIIPLLSTGSGRHEALLVNLSQGFFYRAEVGPYESDTYRIRVVKPPAIDRVVLRYTYPPYTGIAPRIQDRRPLDAIGPAGTRIQLTMNASKPLAASELTLPDGRRALTRGVDGTWHTEFTLARSGEAVLTVRDEDGFTSPSPERFSLTAVEDARPQVVLLEPGRDLSLTPGELATVPLKVFVTDDHGIARVALRVTISQRIEYEYQETHETIPLPLSEQSGRKMTIEHAWDLSRRALGAGDTVTYYVEAADHWPGGAPGSGRVGVSRSYVIRIPVTAQVVGQIDKEETEEIQSAEDLVRRQRALEEKVDRVVREVSSTRELDYRGRKELDSIVARQKEIAHKAQEVAARMASTLDQMRRHELVDPGTLEKLGQVQRLFAEVADSKMKEMMERLREMMAGARLDPQQMAKLMQHFDKNRYSKELDRLIKALKRLKIQKDMDTAVRQARALGQRLEELKTKTAARIQARQETRPLAREQEEISAHTQSLLKGIEKLSRDMAGEFPESAKNLATLAREARQGPMPRAMKEATEALAGNKGSKAYQKESEAASQMGQLERQLSQEKERLQKKRIEFDLAALTRLIELGLGLSRIQGGLVAQAFSLGQAARDLRQLCLGLAGRQYVVVRGGHMLEKDMEEGFPDEVAFKGSFLTHIAQMLEEMQEAKKNYEDSRAFSGRQLSSRALARLNVLMLKLIELLATLQNMDSQASSDSFFDQLERMIERQRKVNEQCQRIKADAPLSPFLQQMMQQMAAEQEMVRQSMEELARKYDQARSILGDLSGLSNEMKEVEEALRRFDRSAQTRERQDRVLTRMLEYQKSVRKQGESRKRRADTAQGFTPVKPPPIPSAITDLQRQLYENIGREGFPPTHQKLVEEYFSSFGR